MKTAAARQAEGALPSSIKKAKIVSSPGELKIPKTLSAKEKALWRSVVAMMPEDQLGAVDEWLMTELVEAWSMLQICKVQWRKYPLDSDARNGFTIASRAFNALAAQFGLSPSTRRLIEITPAAEPAGEVATAQDTFGEILARLGGGSN